MSVGDSEVIETRLQD